MDSIVKGSCKNMCPTREMKMREKNKLLHPLEILCGTENTKIPKADPDKTIKEYFRPAAGVVMTNAADLRSFNVLLKSVKYLIGIIISSHNLSLVYGFVSNRMRAIQQDMIIQQLKDIECISLLEPILAFYIYASYRLCEKPESEFSTKLNELQITECFTTLIYCYDNIETKYDLIDNKSQKKLFNHLPNRCAVESLILLYHLEDEIYLQRAFKIHKIWKTSCFATTLQIRSLLLRGNYVKPFKLIRYLPPLLAAAVGVKLQHIQRKALKIWSFAYNSKVEAFPITVFQEQFLFNSREHLLQSCIHYGISVDDLGIRFDKKNFNSIVKVISPTKQKFVEEKLQHFSSNFFLYRS